MPSLAEIFGDFESSPWNPYQSALLSSPLDPENQPPTLRSVRSGKRRYPTSLDVELSPPAPPPLRPQEIQNPYIENVRTAAPQLAQQLDTIELRFGPLTDSSRMYVLDSLGHGNSLAFVIQGLKQIRAGRLDEEHVRGPLDEKGATPEPRVPQVNMRPPLLFAAPPPHRPPLGAIFGVPDDRPPLDDIFADFSDVSGGSSAASDPEARERKRRQLLLAAKRWQLAEARAHGDLGAVPTVDTSLGAVAKEGAASFLTGVGRQITDIPEIPGRIISAAVNPLVRAASYAAPSRLGMSPGENAAMRDRAPDAAINVDIPGWSPFAAEVRAADEAQQQRFTEAASALPTPVAAGLDWAKRTATNTLDPLNWIGAEGAVGAAGGRRGVQVGAEQASKTAMRDVLEEEAPRLFDRRGIAPDPGYYGPLTAEEEAALVARRAAPPPADSLPTLKSMPRTPEVLPEGDVGSPGISRDVPTLRVFHGSPRTDLAVLRDGSPRQFDNATSPLGVFFTPDEVEAAKYAGKTGRVYPADLQMQNPKEMPWSDFSYYQDITHGLRDADGFRGPSLAPEEWPAREAQLKTEMTAYRQDLEAAGHDGVIVRNRQGEPIEIASFKDVPVAPERPSLSDLFAGEEPTPMRRDASAPREIPQNSAPNGLDSAPSRPPGPPPEPGVLPGMETPEPLTTGTKNAVTAAEREARGLPEVEAIAHKGEGWDEARQIYERDPLVARDLAAHVAEHPRPLRDVEESLLIHDRMRLTLEYNEALSAEEAALKAGDTEGAGMARIRRSSIEAAMNTNDLAARAGGSEWSATGRARQKLIAEDYSPLRLVQKYRVANAGVEAPEVVRAKLVEISQQLDAARAGQTAAEERLAQREAELAVRSVQKDAAAAGRGARRAATKQQLDTEYRDLLAEFDKKAAESQQEVKAVLTPLGGFNPETAKLIMQLAKNRVKAGVNDLGGLVDGLFQDFRHRIEGLEPRDIRDIIASGAPARQQVAKSQAVQDLAKLRSQAKLFQKLETLEAGEQLAKRAKRAAPPPELAALRQKAREVADLMGVSGMSDEARIAAARTRALAREKELTDQIASGLFVKKTRLAPLVEPPDLIAARARVKGLQDQANGIIRRRELADRTFPEKALDLTAGWGRFLKLTGTATVQKIVAAASERALVFKPLEEFLKIPDAYTPVVKHFAANAPIEGGASLKAIGKSYAGFFGKQARAELLAGLRGEEGPFSQAMNAGREHPEQGVPEWMQYPGRVHAGFKAPAKIAAYEYAMEKQAGHYLRKGQVEALRDPVKIAEMKARAYEYANRDIFMGDNALSAAITKALQDKPGQTMSAKTMKAAGKVLMPIQRVPTNYAIEATHYLAGIPKAGLRMQNVLRAGAKVTKDQADRTIADIVKAGLDHLAAQKGGMTAADQADQIMMNLTKGKLGAGLLALGATGVVTVGGYYRPGEHRGEDDLHPGEIQIGGHSTGVVLPHNLLHHPAIEMLQVGGTIYKAKTLGEGITDSVWGLGEQVPFFDEPLQAARASLHDRQGTTFLGQQGRGMTLPPDAQRLARVLDQKEPTTTGEKVGQYIGLGGLRLGSFAIPEIEPVKRKPRGNFVEKLTKEEYLGIPGYRPRAGGPPVEEQP